MADADPQQQIAMLTILLATCETCLREFKAANHVVDELLVADLERMVERTNGALDALVALVARNPSPDPA